MESIGDESSSLEITPDLGTEESTARDIKVPSQGGDLSKSFHIMVDRV